MGCDIYSTVEVQDQTTNQWQSVDLDPFPDRNYGLFGFLANVRNYACCEPLAEPRGVPEDWKVNSQKVPADYYGFGQQDECYSWEDGYHSHSWFLASELLAFDYQKTFWNRRITKNGCGSALAQEGEGEVQSYREFLGENYFNTLNTLKTLGKPEHVRVVFYFD